MLILSIRKKCVTNLLSGQERSEPKNCAFDGEKNPFFGFTLRRIGAVVEQGESGQLENAAPFTIETVKRLDFLKHLQGNGKRNTASAAKRRHTEGLPALP